jgi:4-hydroxythreonine-4-phosphate dehydrogenase
MTSARSNNEKTLRIAITMGDPAGVGPEIIVRLFEEFVRNPGLLKFEDVSLLPFVVGSAERLRRVFRSAGFATRLEPVLTEDAVRIAGGNGELDDAGIPVWEPEDMPDCANIPLGVVDERAGAAAWACVRQAVQLVQTGRADAIVTAPLHKEALNLAGCPFPGHTELLSHLAGDASVVMLLVGGGIRVALVTIHEPLSKVPSLLSPQIILERLRVMNRFLPYFGVPENKGTTVPYKPRIGVTGLNPHGGEGGLFGGEEANIILPAVRAAQAEGINAVGPIPGDTAFHFHREGRYDGILAMYHDQALIPVKTLAFHDGVNVTMGLPFIRASVDHGTAFDIVDQGVARHDSLRAAFLCAARLKVNRDRLRNLE